jgi:hypothetical protein
VAFFLLLVKHPPNMQMAHMIIEGLRAADRWAFTSQEAKLQRQIFDQHPACFSPSRNPKAIQN